MIWILCIFLGLLQIGDALTTLYILNNGGRELNPIMNWLFKVFKTPTNAFIVKGLITFIIGIFLAFESFIVLVIVIVFYVLLVSWNLYHVYKIKTRK